MRIAATRRLVAKGRMIPGLKKGVFIIVRSSFIYIYTGLGAEVGYRSSKKL